MRAAPRPEGDSQCPDMQILLVWPHAAKTSNDPKRKNLRACHVFRTQSDASLNKCTGPRRDRSSPPSTKSKASVRLKKVRAYQGAECAYVTLRLYLTLTERNPHIKEHLKGKLVISIIQCSDVRQPSSLVTIRQHRWVLQQEMAVVSVAGGWQRLT